MEPTDEPRSTTVESRRRSVSAGMKLGRMRWVDHWVGLPACFVFGLLATALRKVLPERNRQVTGTRPLAILKFFGLGSIMEATPLLRAIRRRYPQARLIFVTFHETGALVRRLGICTDVRVIRTSSPVRFVLDCLRTIIWLRGQRVEAVVDLEFFSKFSTLMTFLSGAHVRIGYHLNEFWRRSLVTHPIYFNYFRHITDVFDEAGLQMDVTIEDTTISRLDVGEEARRQAAESLRSVGWSENSILLGVNVNSGELCHERRWPIERFAQVVQTVMQDRPELRVVLTGAPSERRYVSSLLDHLPASLHGRIFNAAGVWSLEAFIASLPLMDGLLTNDSGPMHLAASQGTPMVSLWGPARPGFIAPRVDNMRVIYRDYRCSPCVNMFTSFEGMWCNHEGWCMQAIETPEVLSAVREMLAEVHARRKEPGSGSTTEA
ncbi:MAG TPA: glycosyltransferase family 9 protein [Phycisphaerae bacterium]|nr:glycosyltransferase family 9 protein [Phycisphaerae bacterium]